jgi:hypothetical protein
LDWSRQTRSQRPRTWELAFAVITVVTTRFGRGKLDPTVRVAVSRVSASAGLMQIGSHQELRITEAASTGATTIAAGFTITTVTTAGATETSVESSSQASTMAEPACACSEERGFLLRSTCRASFAALGPRIVSGLVSLKAGVFSKGLGRTAVAGR